MSLINQLNATTEYFWLQTDPVDILLGVVYQMQNGVFVTAAWRSNLNFAVEGTLWIVLLRCNIWTGTLVFPCKWICGFLAHRSWRHRGFHIQGRLHLLSEC